MCPLNGAVMISSRDWHDESRYIVYPLTSVSQQEQDFQDNRVNPVIFDRRNLRRTAYRQYDGVGVEWFWTSLEFAWCSYHTFCMNLERYTLDFAMFTKLVEQEWNPFWVYYQTPYQLPSTK